jgi:hypothetical protein
VTVDEQGRLFNPPLRVHLLTSIQFLTATVIVNSESNKIATARLATIRGIKSTTAYSHLSQLKRRLGVSGLPYKTVRQRIIDMMQSGCIQLNRDSREERISMGVASAPTRRGCNLQQDKERWERIFQEKFANPDYYRQGATPRFTSPLHDA